MAKGKRVEIVKLTVDGPDGITIEVDGKVCTKCGEVKALGEFGADRRASDGLQRGLEFDTQYTDHTCRYKHLCRFDFAVFYGSSVCIIEYDGRHHFEPVVYRDIAEAERQFRNTQRRDRIKDDYCRANGIPLIRIKYTQFDEIEAILDRRFSTLDITGKCPNVEAA